MSKKLVLASASPRRIAMLEASGYEFEIRPADVDEHFNSELSVIHALEAIAYLKAKHVFKPFNQEVVLAADTIVVFKDLVLGKPKDKDHAKRILKELSNQRHQVITGVCLLSDETLILEHEITHVTFYDLSDQMIDEYLKHDEAYDKAGAYAIQGLAKVFVKEVEGDYDNIVGLPLTKAKDLLEKQGIRVAKA